MGTEAVASLIAQCQGPYTQRTYNTTARDFKPSYANSVSGFCRDHVFNPTLVPYVPQVETPLYSTLVNMNATLCRG